MKVRWSGSAIFGEGVDGEMKDAVRSGTVDPARKGRTIAQAGEGQLIGPVGILHRLLCPGGSHIRGTGCARREFGRRSIHAR